jgi:hypothetical protein
MVHHFFGTTSSHLRLEAHALAAHVHKQQQQPNTQEQQHVHLDFKEQLKALLYID